MAGQQNGIFFRESAITVDEGEPVTLTLYRRQGGAAVDGDPVPGTDTVR